MSERKAIVDKLTKLGAAFPALSLMLQSAASPPPTIAGLLEMVDGLSALDLSDTLTPAEIKRELRSIEVPIGIVEVLTGVAPMTTRGTSTKLCSDEKRVLQESSLCLTISTALADPPCVVTIWHQLSAEEERTAENPGMILNYRGLTYVVSYRFVRTLIRMLEEVPESLRYVKVKP